MKWSIAWRVSLLILLVVACVGMALYFPARADQSPWWPWVTSAFVGFAFATQLLRSIRAVRRSERSEPTG